MFDTRTRLFCFCLPRCSRCRLKDAAGSGQQKNRLRLRNTAWVFNLLFRDKSLKRTGFLRLQVLEN